MGAGRGSGCTARWSGTKCSSYEPGAPGILDRRRVAEPRRRARWWHDRPSSGIRSNRPHRRRSAEDASRRGLGPWPEETCGGPLVVGTSLHGELDPIPQGSRRRTWDISQGRRNRTPRTFKESTRVQWRHEDSSGISARRVGFVSGLRLAPPGIDVRPDPPVTDMRGDHGTFRPPRLSAAGAFATFPSRTPPGSGFKALRRTDACRPLSRFSCRQRVLKRLPP